MMGMLFPSTQVGSVFFLFQGRLELVAAMAVARATVSHNIPNKSTKQTMSENYDSTWEAVPKMELAVHSDYEMAFGTRIRSGYRGQ